MQELTGVMIFPGQRVLTLMPLLLHSMAKLRPSWTTAAFEQLYTLVRRPLFAIKALIDPTSTIDPTQPYFSIWRQQLTADR
jgi:hypothetical protein